MKKTIQEIGISQEELDNGLRLSGGLELLSEGFSINNCRATIVMIDCFTYELNSSSTTTVIHADLINPTTDIDITTYDATALTRLGIGDYYVDENVEYRTVSSVNLGTNPIQITVDSAFSSAELTPGRPIILVWEAEGTCPFDTPYDNTPDTWAKYTCEDVLVPFTTDVIDLGFIFDDSDWTTGNDFNIRSRRFQLHRGTYVPPYTAPAPEGPKLTLVASDNTFFYSNATGTPALLRPSQIDFTLNRESISGNTTWSLLDNTGTPVGAGNLTGLTNTTAILTEANFAATGEDSVIVRASAHSGYVYSEQVINKVIPPASSTIYYINPTTGITLYDDVGSITLQARQILENVDSLLSSGTIQLYDGTTALGYSATFDSTDIPLDTTLTITMWDGVSADPVDSITLINVSSGADGVAGYNTATLTAYKRSATTPTDDPGTVTYTFATAGWTPANGWSKTIPSGTDPCYAVSATAYSQSAADQILDSEWSSPVIVFADGADGSNGTDGLNVATAFIYQRTTTSSTPTLPSVSADYTFATGGITGLDNGWTATVPAFTGSNPYLWISLATASSSSTIDTIGSGEWQTPHILSQNGTDGTPGVDGYNTATLYAYKRATSTPGDTPGTITYTFATSSWTPLNSWSKTIPSGTDPCYAVAATAYADTATDEVLSTDWSSPVIVFADGATGDPGLNVATAYVYQRTATDSAPSVPSADVTFTFATGGMTGLTNNWVASIPAYDSAAPYLWITHATASNTATTDIIGTGEWSTPAKILQNAIDGKPVNYLQMSQWVVGGTGTQGDFTEISAGQNANSIVLGGESGEPLGPFNMSTPMWKVTVTPDTPAGPDGGWNYYTSATNAPAIDPEKSYLYICWYRCLSTATGAIYLGANTSDVLTLAGAPATNPYFITTYTNAISMEDEKWYLGVGVLHGSDYAGGESGLSGLWDPDTGTRIYRGNEYKNVSSATHSGVLRHRAYHYYDTLASQEQWFARPGLYLMDGTEPDIYQMMQSARNAPGSIVYDSDFDLTDTTNTWGANNFWGLLAKGTGTMTTIGAVSWDTDGVNGSVAAHIKRGTYATSAYAYVATRGYIARPYGTLQVRVRYKGTGTTWSSGFGYRVEYYQRDGTYIGAYEAGEYLQATNGTWAEHVMHINMAVSGTSELIKLYVGWMNGSLSWECLIDSIYIEVIPEIAGQATYAGAGTSLGAKSGIVPAASATEVTAKAGLAPDGWSDQFARLDQNENFIYGATGGSRTGTISSGTLTLAAGSGTTAANTYWVNLNQNLTNFTLSMTDGQSVQVLFYQSGSYTVTFPAAWYWPGSGTAPTVTTGTGSRDLLVVTRIGSLYFAQLIQDFLT